MKEIEEARKKGYSDEEIYDYLSKNKPELKEKFNKAAEAGYQASETLDYLSKQSKFPGLVPYLMGETTESLAKRSERNRKMSATAILLNQGLSLDEIQAYEKEDKKFLTNVYDTVNTLGWDLPLMAISAAPGAAGGAALGAALGPIGAGVGGAAGGAATAFGTTEAIKNIYRQYLEHQAQGGPLTLDEFFERAVNVLDPTIKAAVMGALTGGTGKGAGVAKEGLKKAASEFGGEIIGFETGKALTGEKITPESLVEDIATVGALKAAGKGTEIIGKAGEALEKGAKTISEATKPREQIAAPEAPLTTPPEAATKERVPGTVKPSEIVPAQKNITELQEEALNILSPQPTEAQKKITEGAEKKKGEPLKGRVRIGGEDVGLRPAPRIPLTPREEVGSVFSPYEFYNTSEGGRAFGEQIRNMDRERYAQVNHLYDVSRAEQRRIETTHPELVENLLNQLDELETIAHPSGPQKEKIKALNDVINSLAVIGKDKAGNRIITGQKAVRNQNLINQVQSLHQKVDFDFAHGHPKNIFNPMISALNDSIEFAARNHPRALQAHTEAKRAYSEWAEEFNNDYIRPFRDTTNRDYSKLYKSTLDVDELAMIKRILDPDPTGRILTSASERALVDKFMSKYLENPKLMTEPEFSTRLRELEAVITPEQAQTVRDVLSRHQRPAAKGTFEKPSKIEYKSLKDVENSFNDVQTIRKIKKDLDAKGREDLFDQLAEDKFLDIVKGGQATAKKVTGREIAQRVGKRENYKIVKELYGEEAIDSLLKEAERARDNPWSEENLEHFIDTVGKGLIPTKFGKALYKLAAPSGEKMIKAYKEAAAPKEKE